MQIFVKTLTGYTLTVEIENTDTGYDLKKKLQQKILNNKELHSSPDVFHLKRYRVIFCGKVIPDKATLANYDFASVGIIHLVIVKNPDLKNIPTAATYIAQASRHSSNLFYTLPQEILHKITASVSTSMDETESFNLASSAFDAANALHSSYTPPEPIQNSPDENQTINRKIWLNTVYALYSCINSSIDSSDKLSTAAACTFTATVLNAIRKGYYSGLCESPEDIGGIPLNIFKSCVIPFMQKNPLLLTQEFAFDGIENESRSIENALFAECLEPFAELQYTSNHDAPEEQTACLHEPVEETNTNNCCVM